LVLLRDKTKPGAVIRAKPFSHYWNIWFPTRFTLRAQQATGCIFQIFGQACLCEPQRVAQVCASPFKGAVGGARPAE
jgi:hypothetical protein